MTRIGVVGAGPMGRLHAYTVQRLAGCGSELQRVQIFDRHGGRAEELAAEIGAEATVDLDVLSERVDAVIVSVPTAAHFEIAESLLSRGIDLLVEKPLAASVKEGEVLWETARRAGRILQVGHVEWYNPGWRDAVRLAGSLHRIEVVRLQPPSARGRDIDVVQDLMLHDLDWTTRLVGEPVIRIEARGRCVEGDQLDEVEARLHFGSGRVARLHASRVHATSRREAHFEGSAGRSIANLQTGRVEMVEATGPGVIQPSEKLSPDPLESQWHAFTEAIRSRRDPVNDGRVGIDALLLVDRVREAAAKGRGELHL